MLNKNTLGVKVLGLKPKQIMLCMSYKTSLIGDFLASADIKAFGRT